MDLNEIRVLQIAWHLATSDPYNRALLLILNLSTKIRRAIMGRFESIRNYPLHQYIENALARTNFITTAFRAKFLPYKAFIAYIQDRIEEKDYRPVKLYFEQTKRDASLPKLKICLQCAKKRFISQELKLYIAPQSPCDLELYQETTQTPVSSEQSAKRRLVDIAVGPDDPRFDRDWIRDTSGTQLRPHVVATNEQPQLELTEEQKQAELVKVLTRKDEPPLDNFGNFLALSGLRRFAWN